MTEYVMSRALKILQRHEPAHVWMYWHASKESVCIGYGHRLPTLQDACDLGWTYTDYDVKHFMNGHRVNAGHVDSGWGYVAQTHCAYTRLRIDTEDIIDLARQDIEKAERELSQEWGAECWEARPSAVQIALIDMRLTDDKPSDKLRRALLEGEYRVAAIYAMREKLGPIGPARPGWIGSRNHEIETLLLGVK